MMIIVYFVAAIVALSKFRALRNIPRYGGSNFDYLTTVLALSVLHILHRALLYNY